MHDLIIEAGRTERQYWRDLWGYRELFLFLSWRDLLVRYKQTVVGISWCLIRPFLTTLVLAIVFGRFGKMPSGGVPYPLLVLCGILPWQFFASGLTESGSSLVSNSNLISKVYFPRVLVPASSVLTSMVDLVLSGLVLLGFMIWYGVSASMNVVFLPSFLLLAALITLGCGLWVAALMVRYRDLRFVIPFVVQFGLYLSPVGFSSSVVPDSWRIYYSLNPMVGVIDGFRWCLLGGDQRLYLPGLVLSCVMAAALLIGGVWFFRKSERTFADVI